MPKKIDMDENCYSKKNQTINLYTAIEQMKQISSVGDTFSISFRKYDRQRKSGGDSVRLKYARLRPKTSDAEIENSSYKLFITDTETGKSLNCWQILVTEFNGFKIYV